MGTAGGVAGSAWWSGTVGWEDASAAMGWHACRSKVARGAIGPGGGRLTTARPPKSANGASLWRRFCRWACGGIHLLHAPPPSAPTPPMLPRFPTSRHRAAATPPIGRQNYDAPPSPPPRTQPHPPPPKTAATAGTVSPRPPHRSRRRSRVTHHPSAAAESVLHSRLHDCRNSHHHPPFIPATTASVPPPPPAAATATVLP